MLGLKTSEKVVDILFPLPMQRNTILQGTASLIASTYPSKYPTPIYPYKIVVKKPTTIPPTRTSLSILLCPALDFAVPLAAAPVLVKLAVELFPLVAAAVAVTLALAPVTSAVEVDPPSALALVLEGALSSAARLEEGIEDFWSDAAHVAFWRPI